MSRYDGAFDSEPNEWNGWGLSQALACERKLCFKDSPLFQGVPLQPKTLRMFDMGSAAEMVVKLNHPDMQLTMQQFKVRVLDRGGKLDGVIVDNAIKEAFIWECKSMNSRAFAKFKQGVKAGKGVRELKPQYYAQAQLYMHAMNEYGITFYGKPIVQTIFTIIERDMGDISVTVFRYDNVFVSSIVLKRIDKVNAAKAEGAILGVPNYLEPWECNYCDFKSTCKAKPQSKFKT